ncbi:organoarsenical effux MFS transporter ArsJ [Siccirubricoccus sp. KC 17139]|uniref:Organoarsenical effux MFS transporter ArsJ n=1 Tax=Siccirubricoccus soli TaxID=2899147 RepID=A0ABT1D2G2_9PROT|nr:organoarsenical effux MFS transporter ArsJ [Siccirubricoccus soli]MCO6416103.1 organoarsenical effux MFS transporter ArsJ [Siccirubricoccus soli]MCP2682235.1 organoarsenical effux MFS transporter ArsJ [Siccirubricoccus soli]
MSALRNYLVVTGAYWGFTLTDGALRMLVLLHFYQLGYTPFMLAFLFLLYEAAGILANFGGGWLATRFGIPRMLTIGLSLQIVGLLMLSALDPGWGAAASVAWVVAAQGIAGVAKDLTKTASKSAIKATSQQGAGQLFRWVAWFTGSKNAMKGFGFFVGGLLLQFVGFRPALWLMAGLLVAALAGVLLSLPRELGKAKASKSFRELFAKTRAINLLAAARIFMFGARDVWFVVGLPVFLYASGWSFLEVSGFLAAWTIGYGGVQALAPSVVRRSPDGLSREVPEARLWCAALAAIPAVLALVLASETVARPDVVVVVGLAIFGFAFAVLSSLHSYLILAYAGSEKAAEDVGFYYAANAAGRLMGILLSGSLTQYAGLQGCLWGSAAMLAACAALTFLLPTGAEARRAVV